MISTRLSRSTRLKIPPALCLALLASFASLLLCATRLNALELPRLDWEPRSDWLNVCKFGAKGEATYLKSTDIEPTEALPHLSRALDDLRLLGEVDLRLNHPGK